MRYFYLLLFGIFQSVSSIKAQPLGTWQEHLPYNMAIDLARSSDKIIAATPYSCFSVSGADNAFERFSRIQGLSETGIQAIFCTPNGTLVIAYENSAIDILANGKIQNVNALQVKQINGDKRIYQINGDDEQCLLSTGFGIVILNLVKKEIGDSWILGAGGASEKIFATEMYGGYYYAATEDGLKKAPVNSANLADFRSWVMLSGTSGLPPGPVQQVLVVKGSVYAQVGSTLFVEKNNQFQAIYSDANSWINTNSSGDKILICQRTAGGAAVQTLLPDGTIGERITHPLISNPKKTMYTSTSLWIADSSHGLLEKTAAGITAWVPNSPNGIGTGGLIANNHDWWASTGDAISHFSGSEWSSYNTVDQTIPFPFRKAGPLLLVKNGVFWAGSYQDGLLKKENDQLLNFKDGLLSPSYEDPQAYRVTGLATDIENNLWISNSGAKNGLVVLTPAGVSKSFTIPFLYTGYAISQVIIDDFNQKWILSPNGNGLFCFNHGASVDNPADDQWRMFKAGSGNGNLPSNNIFCIAKDGFGFIWVGTADGIGIFECVSQVFSGQGCEAILPVVQSDQFAGYLFKGEVVQAIAVDAANRKWIGTKNGTWLLSADGRKTIHRFTTSNSPLLNNDINHIAIDPADGTVLFSTASGICTFKGDAVQGGSTNTTVLVYPNPVPPGYNGPIAIKGLVNNANVKITELNGRLVYEGRALGGQMVWNGRNLQGKIVSTGVYLVMVSDDERREQVVSKIVFIQR